LPKSASPTKRKRVELYLSYISDFDLPANFESEHFAIDFLFLCPLQKVSPLRYVVNSELPLLINVDAETILFFNTCFAPGEKLFPFRTFVELFKPFLPGFLAAL